MATDFGPVDGKLVPEAVPTSTQNQHPWKATARTVLEWIIGVALVAPQIYSAITNGDPAAATGWAATALAISAAVTRVAALPFFDRLLSKIGLGSLPKAKLAPRRLDK